VSPTVQVTDATPVESVVLDATETDPPPVVTVQPTATLAIGAPFCWTRTRMGMALPTTTLSVFKVESAAIVTPVDVVGVPPVGVVASVVTGESVQAAAVMTAAAQTMVEMRMPG
jgi:hypothetical protein